MLPGNEITFDMSRFCIIKWLWLRSNGQDRNGENCTKGLTTVCTLSITLSRFRNQLSKMNYSMGTGR
jgi:hypothetical protein